MQILWSFTHRHVVLMLYEFLIEHKRNISRRMSFCVYIFLYRPTSVKGVITWEIKFALIFWIWGAMWHHKGPNICIDTASRARHRQIVSSPMALPNAVQSLNVWLDHAVLRQKQIEITITNAILSTLDTVYNMCVRFRTQSAVRLSSGQMEWKNVRFDTFGLNSVFASLYRYQKDPSVRNKWIVYL